MRMKSILKILCTLVLITGLTACVPENKHANDSSDLMQVQFIQQEKRIIKLVSILQGESYEKKSMPKLW